MHSSLTIEKRGHGKLFPIGRNILVVPSHSASPQIKRSIIQRARSGQARAGLARRAIEWGPTYSAPALVFIPVS